MEYEELIRRRYSCRNLDEYKEVSKDLIDKILEAGRLAPTATNAQPMKFLVYESKEALENINEITPYTFGAKTFILVLSSRDKAYDRHFDGFNFADVDASIALTQMMLEIYNLGLGTTWVGYLDSNKFYEIYPEYKDYQLVGLLPIGYVKDGDEPSSRHEKRKSFDDLVTKL